jgi:hypothetical protein
MLWCSSRSYPRSRRSKPPRWCIRRGLRSVGRGDPRRTGCGTCPCHARTLPAPRPSQRNRRALHPADTGLAPGTSSRPRRALRCRCHSSRWRCHWSSPHCWSSHRCWSSPRWSCRSHCCRSLTRPPPCSRRARGRSGMRRRGGCLARTSIQGTAARGLRTCQRLRRRRKAARRCRGLAWGSSARWCSSRRW